MPDKCYIENQSQAGGKNERGHLWTNNIKAVEEHRMQGSPFTRAEVKRHAGDKYCAGGGGGSYPPAKQAMTGDDHQCGQAPEDEREELHHLPMSAPDPCDVADRLCVTVGSPERAGNDGEESG